MTTGYRSAKGSHRRFYHPTKSGPVTANLREVIAEHLDVLREMGEAMPTPHSRAGVIQIAS